MSHCCVLSSGDGCGGGSADSTVSQPYTLHWSLVRTRWVFFVVLATACHKDGANEGYGEDKGALTRSTYKILCFSLAADPKSAFSGEPLAARGRTASSSTTQITGASTGTNSPADWEVFIHNWKWNFLWLLWNICPTNTNICDTKGAEVHCIVIPLQLSTSLLCSAPVFMQIWSDFSKECLIWFRSVEVIGH